MIESINRIITNWTFKKLGIAIKNSRCSLIQDWDFLQIYNVFSITRYSIGGEIVFLVLKDTWNEYLKICGSLRPLKNHFSLKKKW